MREIYLGIAIVLLSGCFQTTNNTSVPPKKVKEIKDDKKNLICTEEFKPVCAKIELNCVTTPCPSSEKTFSNRCIMEKNSKATFLHEGACKPKANI